MTACVPCPRGTTCCGRVWGRCICYRPVFGRCCKTVPDVACHTANAGCYALKKPIQASLRAAQAVLHRARHTVHVANAAFIPLERGVRAAQGLVRGAEHALRGVERGFSVGLQASNFIARVGVNGLISIREIKFHTSLGAAAGGLFSGSVRVVFVGAAERTVHLRINLRNIKSMAKQLVSHIGRGFSSLF